MLTARSWFIETVSVDSTERILRHFNQSPRIHQSPLKKTLIFINMKHQIQTRQRQNKTPQSFFINLLFFQTNLFLSDWCKNVCRRQWTKVCVGTTRTFSLIKRVFSSVESGGFDGWVDPFSHVSNDFCPWETRTNTFNDTLKTLVSVSAS